MGRVTGAGTARLHRALGLPAGTGPSAAGLDGRGAGDRAPAGAGGRAGDGEDDQAHVVLGGSRRGPQDGRDDPPAPGGTARHAVDPALRAAGWRLGGVPAGAAVAAVVVALVVSLLLLDGGGADEEVLVGPGAGSTGSALDDGSAGGADTGPGDGAADDGAAGDGEGGDGEGGGHGVPAALPGPAAPAAPGLAGAGAAPGDPARPASAGSGAATPPGPLVVHVDGAVLRPGVVTVPAGSRVSDAVAAAGGMTPEADTRLVNLARVLGDGELVVVPVPGEVVPPAAGAPPGADGLPGAGSDAVAPGGGAVAPVPLDLNAADAAALDALPGIGPVLAARIVAHREEVGPFASVDDLDAVSGIGPSLMGDLRDRVTV